ncbi:hypothetical protein NPIL_641681 [Nephila pilipes]|uniref:Uncharacterized protein n=1 Tax=Nephila pilipes TaxID=299642 RepID=A0A8X6QDK6_NEPPI|nr:hypothetical protein NPIL_641681 [Nephila pilipes]
MDQDLTNGRSGTPEGYISDDSSLGCPRPFCCSFGCLELVEQVCCNQEYSDEEGFLMTVDPVSVKLNYSNHETDSFSAYVMTKEKLLSEQREGFVQLDNI